MVGHISMKKAAAASLGAIAWMLFTAASAQAARWWNPLSWFESPDVKVAKAVYKAERISLENSLEEAWREDDPETIRQARKELIEFDKDHQRHLRELRKKTHAQMRLAHKADHKAVARRTGKGFRPN